MKIFLTYSNKNNLLNKQVFCNIITKLVGSNIQIFMLNSKLKPFENSDVISFKKEFNAIRECDTIIAIGGDGTIIKYAKFAHAFNKLMLGINNGRMGITSSADINDFSWIEKLISNKYKIEEKTVGTLLVDNENHFFLNDVVISRGPTSPIADYELSKNCEKITNYRADGLIFSTPLGSTAYNLSAGGPIVDSNMECIVVTPICSHSFNSHSLIFDTKNTLKLNYKLRLNSSVFITVDGNLCFESFKSGCLEIKADSKKVKFIKFNNELLSKTIKKIHQSAIDETGIFV